MRGAEPAFNSKKYMMKYMKAGTSFLMLLLMSVCLGTLVSCGEDDNANNDASGASGSTSKLVGTWYNSDGDSYVFKADGTGTYKDHDDPREYFDYIYNESKAVLKLYFEDDTKLKVYTVISLTDSRLVWEDEDGDVETLTKGNVPGGGSEDKPNSSVSKLIGIWEYRSSEGYGIGRFQFNADGTGKMEEGIALTELFSYDISYVYDEQKGKIYIYYVDDGAREVLTVVKLTDTVLVLREGDGEEYTYTKKSGNVNPTPETFSLIGTWTWTYDTGYTVVTFKADGTGTIRDVDYYYGTDTETFTYVYDSQSGVIYMTFGDETEIYTVVKSESTSTKLVVYDGDEYMTFIKTS